VLYNVQVFHKFIFWKSTTYLLEISKNYLLKAQNLLVPTYGSKNNGLMEIIISSEAKKLFFYFIQGLYHFHLCTYLGRYAKKGVNIDHSFIYRSLITYI